MKAVSIMGWRSTLDISRLLAVLLSLTPLPSKALCDEGLIYGVAKKFGFSLTPNLSITSSAGRDDGLLFACKTLPYNPSFTAMAFASLNGEATRTDKFFGGRNFSGLSAGDGKYDLTTLLLRTADGKILGRYLGRAELESSAVTLDEIAIDPADYRLSDSAVTFGVRVNNFSHSRSYIAAATTLSLFSYKNGKLAKVLDKLPVTSHSGNLKLDCFTSGLVEQVNRSIAVSSSESNGMRNLVIRTTTHKVETSEGCEEDVKETETKVSDGSYEYVFNGRAYGRKRSK